VNAASAYRTPVKQNILDSGCLMMPSIQETFQVREVIELEFISINRRLFRLPIFSEPQRYQFGKRLHTRRVRQRQGVLQVTRWAHIRILPPVIGVRRKKDIDAEKDIRSQNQALLVGFRSAYVFDVSQTEGKDLPELSERVTGNVGEYRERLLDFIAAQSIQLEFKESIAPALGMSYGGRIAILPGQGAAEEFSTLIHELAPEMLHKAERRIITTKTVRETEAEAIAFVVSKTIGLNTGTASADYIHLYRGNSALLTESLEVIQRASAIILSALETNVADQTTEADAQLVEAS
jgi:hypothetical protein